MSFKYILDCKDGVIFIADFQKFIISEEKPSEVSPWMNTLQRKTRQLKAEGVTNSTVVPNPSCPDTICRWSK